MARDCSQNRHVVGKTERADHTGPPNDRPRATVSVSPALLTQAARQSETRFNTTGAPPLGAGPLGARHRRDRLDPTLGARVQDVLDGDQTPQADKCARRQNRQ